MGLAAETSGRTELEASHKKNLRIVMSVTGSEIRVLIERVQESAEEIEMVRGGPHLRHLGEVIDSVIGWRRINGEHQLRGGLCLTLEEQGPINLHHSAAYSPAR